MKILAKGVVLLLLIAVLVGVPIPWKGQGGTIPGRESSFCLSAEAAPSWLPWFNEEAVDLEFSEMYSGASALGLELSGKLRSLEGKTVRISGFMAPPLKPTLQFFVLTKTPMSICPFCSTDADWPNDIVVVKLSQEVKALPFDSPILVTGQLEIGSAVDVETGFVSLIRIKADNVEAQ